MPISRFMWPRFHARPRRRGDIAYGYVFLMFGVLSLLFMSLTARILRLPCPLRRLTGIACPTCGLNRMNAAVWQGDWWRAFWYNPGFVVAALLFAVWLLVDVRAFHQNRIWMVHPQSGNQFRFWLTAGFAINWLYLIVFNFFYG